MTNVSVSEENKAIVRRLLAEVDRGNLAVVDEAYATSYVDHTPSAIRSLAPGIDGVKKAFAIFLSAFPDSRHEIEDLIAEGDRVVVRLRASGTHTGELMGVPPTGKRVTMTGIAIYRLAGGRIVERWVEQGASILEQLGVAPPAAGNG
jgi:predicted ester cyclase